MTEIIEYTWDGKSNPVFKSASTTLEERLQHISDTAKARRVRYTEVKPIIEEAIAELERLRELEFMYQNLQ